MPDNPAALGDSLIQLAQGVLDDLNTGDHPLDQRIDRLKAVGALYLGLKKHTKEPEPEEDGFSLKATRERIKAVEGEGK